MRARTLLAIAPATVSLSCAAPPRSVPTQQLRAPEGNVVSYECGPVVLPSPRFPSRSAVVDDDMRRLLVPVAAVLQNQPEIVLIELAGHADATEPAELATARARSVMEALVALGVTRSRLRAQGYGAYCPVTTSEDQSDAARARDRRVELKIVETRDGATGVELGCENAAAHGWRPAPIP